jgi:SAM-dependent methyltransferase
MVELIRATLAGVPRARVAQLDASDIDLPDESVDVVATLQVIEHVWNHNEFVGECLRVLRPGGTLLVTTPNRLTFSPDLEVPVNPFHTKEFTAAELSDLLVGNGFDVIGEYGLRARPRLGELDRRYDGSFVGAQLGAPPHTWSERLRGDVASVTVNDFSIDAADVADIDASLDLVHIARRPNR